MTQIKLRRDTSAAFASSNPILGNGEPAYETDTKKLKIGDGTTAYTQLEYFSAGGGGSTNISATLPLKIVDGVISLEVDGQTIQIVDGKLHANLDELGNEVNTLAGRVTAAEADILTKENKITTTGALSLQEKIQTNAVGFTVTSESAMTNNYYQRVPFPESKSSRLGIQDTSFTYPYKSYLAIPYSLGQVIRVPRAYGQLFFGSFDDSGDFIVSVGFNTFYYDTNGFALFGGPVYRAVAGSSEYPPVMPKLNPTQMGYDGNYTYHTPPREAADSCDLYGLSNYLPENDFSCAFYQISPDTTGAIMIQAFWSMKTGRCSTAVYRDTETSYQYAGHLDAMRNNIQYALWLPNETGTSYNPSKFGLYDWNVSRIPWGDDSGWKAFFKGRGANLYSLTGQSSKNYLELNLGSGLSVVDGKLTASSTAPTNMVTTDTEQTISGNKTFKYIGINDLYGGKTRFGNGQSKIEMAYDGQIHLDSATILADQSQNWRVGRYNKAGLIYSASALKRVGNGPTFNEYDILDSSNLGSYVDGTTITYANNKLSAASSGGGLEVKRASSADFNSAELLETGLYYISGGYSPQNGPTPYAVSAMLITMKTYVASDNQNIQQTWIGCEDLVANQIYTRYSSRNGTMGSWTRVDSNKIASSSALGSIKVGEGLTISSDGTLSASGGSAPTNMVTTDTAQTISGDKELTGITTISNDIKFTIGKKITTPDGQWLMQLGAGFIGIGTSMKPLQTYDGSNYYLHNKSIIAGNGIKITEPNSSEIEISSTSTAYVTEEFVDGTEGYRVWSNGRCEQWGQKTSTTDIQTVTFLKTYANTNFTLLANMINSPSTAYKMQGKGATTSSASFVVSDSTHYMAGVLYCWYVSGELGS